MAYIYKILNKLNEKLYIGSTSNLNKRWYTHKFDLNNNNHCNTHLQRAWNKYGEGNFEFIIIEECSEELKIEREQYYLDTILPFYPVGYNIERIAGKVTIGTGENHPKSTLTNQFVIHIKKLLASGIKQTDILNKYKNITIGQLSKIASLNRWVEIGSEYNEQITQNTHRKWNPNWITIVVKMKEEENKTFKEIAEYLNFDESAINKRYNIYKGTIKYKYCEKCGKRFVIKNNRQKYCKLCRNLRK